MVSSTTSTWRGTTKLPQPANVALDASSPSSLPTAVTVPLLFVPPHLVLSCLVLSCIVLSLYLRLPPSLCPVGHSPPLRTVAERDRQRPAHDVDSSQGKMVGCWRFDVISTLFFRSRYSERVDCVNMCCRKRTWNACRLCLTVLVHAAATAAAVEPPVCCYFCARHGCYPVHYCCTALPSAVVFLS